MPDFSCSKKPKRGKNTKLPQNIPNGHKIIPITKWSYNIRRFSIVKPSKIHTNGDFWFENKPSGNHARD
jgi:hypothetical protein